MTNVRVETMNGRSWLSRAPVQIFHERSPSGCGVAVEWLAVFNDALMDAEILIERVPIGEMGIREMAELAGIAPKSVFTHVARGLLPAPTRYEIKEGGRTAVWEPKEIAERVLAG